MAPFSLDNDSVKVLNDACDADHGQHVKYTRE